MLRGEGVRGNGAYGEDEVGHVAVAGNDLQAGDGIGVADDVSDAGGAVLLHPRDVVGVGGGGGGGHGAWVGALAPREPGGENRAIVEGKIGELARACGARVLFRVWPAGPLGHDRRVWNAAQERPLRRGSPTSASASGCTGKKKTNFAQKKR